MEICFTGHRPDKLGGYTQCHLHELVKNSIRDKISFAYDIGYRTFISGGALGVDLWSAWIVLELRQTLTDISLVMALPHPTPNPKWPTSSINQLKNICLCADKVVFVSDDPYAPWKLQVRNEWMVDNSQAVIAVWDGSTGGTANCVRYAEKLKRTIYRIDPKELVDK